MPVTREEAIAELRRRGVPVPGQAGAMPPRPPKLATREQMFLDEARAAARGSDEAALTAEQFVDINRTQNTGGLLALPMAPAIAGAFDPEISRMNALTARMAPQQRQPGSGTTSDRDLSLYLQAVPSPSKPGPVNSSIARQARADAERRSRYAQFLDRYAMQNGSLMGAEEAWKREQATAGKPPSASLTPQQRRAAAAYRGTRADSGTLGNPSIPASEAEYNALPKGVHYIAPDGQVRVKQ